MNNYKYILIALLFFTTAIGCKKLDLSPVYQMTELTYWVDKNNIDSFVNSAYSQMASSYTFFYDEGLSDNAYNGRGDAANVTSISGGRADAATGRFRDQWNNAYRCIKTCNLFLENVDKASGLDATIKKLRIAEVRFIRAYAHYYLANLYGDVPLVTKSLTIAEAKSITREGRQKVIDFVLSELDAVLPDLPRNTELATADRGRLTKGAVMAFKARVYLYESKWPEVIAITEKFMSGSDYGTYALFPSYDGLFLPQNEYNSEVIFDYQFVPLYRTHNEHFDFVPLSVGARLNALAPTQQLVNSYIMKNGKTITEAGSGYDENNPYANRDPRLTSTVVYHGYQWTKKDGSMKTIYTKPGTDPDGAAPDEYKPGGISSPTGYYIRKYYDPTYNGADFSSGLNLILIRYADILLMNAEAKAELGQMDATVWDKTIKLIRQRAGFTDPPALAYNPTNVKEVIRNERRSEFAFESLRFYDIKRWKLSEQVLNGNVLGAKYGPLDKSNGYLEVATRTFNAARDYLWAVPRDEREANRNLTQNPNW